MNKVKHYNNGERYVCQTRKNTIKEQMTKQWDEVTCKRCLVFRKAYKVMKE